MNDQILEPCGCFRHRHFPSVLFPCALHADVPVPVVIEVDREELEQEELRTEAEAWLKWR